MSGIADKKIYFIYFINLKWTVKNHFLKPPASLNQGSAVYHGYNTTEKVIACDRASVAFS